MLRCHSWISRSTSGNARREAGARKPLAAAVAAATAPAPAEGQMPRGRLPMAAGAAMSGVARASSTHMSWRMAACGAFIVAAISIRTASTSTNRYVAACGTPGRRVWTASRRRRRARCSMPKPSGLAGGRASPHRRGWSRSRRLSWRHCSERSRRRSQINGGANTRSLSPRAVPAAAMRPCRHPHRPGTMMARFNALTALGGSPRTPPSGTSRYAPTSSTGRSRRPRLRRGPAAGE
mmetsp:Transcript_84582/g.244430  ORF Transcript_84582/g.244430 Transcript_84582/m.244430 type:complete len:236 (-) Transcript_84582:684-1391(-)